MEDLTKVSHKLAEEIYKQAAAKQQQGSSSGGEPKEEAGDKKGPAPGGKDEDIIDAEYKEEGDNKK